MAITFTTTGPFDSALVRGPRGVTSVATYSYSSGIITTTANYADNILDFGCGLKELWITVSGANAACFQFVEHYDTVKDSGIVLGNSQIHILTLNKRGLKLRSADTALAATVYVFGI